MLLDRFNRKIDYLRISVTDRCNYRCTYCMPGSVFRRSLPVTRDPSDEQQGVHKSHSDIISYEQVESLTKIAAKMGITKIRLTGGEPLVSKNIEQLVAKLTAIDGIDEVCMTTNCSLLGSKTGI